MTDAPAEDDAPFEALLARLGEIARELEGDGVPLEKALALFEEGVRLTRAAQGRLDKAEARVEELVGAGRTKPLDVEATSPKRRG